MIYNKLVRDKIPDIIQNRGDAVKFHIATDTEYDHKLKEKLSEEVAEFLEATDRDHRIEELADILEVIDAIIEYEHISRPDLQKVKAKKRKERGGFKKRIILEES